MTNLGDYWFEYCQNLTSVTLGKNILSIGINAFSNCHHLTTITIPCSVVSIGSGAIYNGDSLTTAYFSDPNRTNIHNRFYRISAP